MFSPAFSHNKNPILNFHANIFPSLYLNPETALVLRSLYEFLECYDPKRKFLRLRSPLISALGVSLCFSPAFTKGLRLCTGSANEENAAAYHHIEPPLFTCCSDINQQGLKRRINTPLHILSTTKVSNPTRNPTTAVTTNTSTALVTYIAVQPFTSDVKSTIPAQS